MVKRSAFAGCLAFYNKATPSVTTPKPASDAVTAPSRRHLKCGDSFRPFGAPSRAVEPALGQETARSMCRFQVRKWSKPHRGFAKKALAHPQTHPKKTLRLFLGTPGREARKCCFTATRRQGKGGNPNKDSLSHGVGLNNPSVLPSARHLPLHRGGWEKRRVKGC